MIFERSDISAEPKSLPVIEFQHYRSLSLINDLNTNYSALEGLNK